MSEADPEALQRFMPTEPVRRSAPKIGRNDPAYAAAVKSIKSAAGSRLDTVTYVLAVRIIASEATPAGHLAILMPAPYVGLDIWLRQRRAEVMWLLGSQPFNNRRRGHRRLL